MKPELNRIGHNLWLWLVTCRACLRGKAIRRKNIVKKIHAIADQRERERERERASSCNQPDLLSPADQRGLLYNLFSL